MSKLVPAVTRRPKPLTEIWTDGVTTWVNGASLLGRFGRTGIDVHRPLSEQSMDGECLFCTHAFTTAADWETFKEKMLEHHGVTVSDRYMPERFK
jgi:hypothetical protein